MLLPTPSILSLRIVNYNFTLNCENSRKMISVSQYLQCVKSFADEFVATRRSMSLVEFNSIIYRNIGHKFHSIDTTLNLCPEPLSFNELYSHLAAHEILFNSVPLIVLLIMLYTNNLQS